MHRGINKGRLRLTVPHLLLICASLSEYVHIFKYSAKTSVTINWHGERYSLSDFIVKLFYIGKSSLTQTEDQFFLDME